MCCKNADIWGIITIYDDIIINNKNILKNKPNNKEALKNLVYRYLYSPEFATKPIDIDTLVNELRVIAPLSNMKPKMVVKHKTTRKRCPYGTKRDPQTDECVQNFGNKEVIDIVSPESNVKSVVKKNKVLIGNKTRRKRCPNGTRRDPKTGECVPKVPIEKTSNTSNIPILKGLF